MLHHIVLFRLREPLAASLAELEAPFAALPAQIAEIAALEVRRDIVGRPVSAHFGLVSQFADRDALARYQQHPAHVAAFEQLKPHLDQMLVLDYES